MVLDSLYDVWVVDDGLKEVVPFFGWSSEISDKISQFLDSLAGDRGLVFVRSGTDGDDGAVREVITIAENGVDKFGMLAKDVGDIAGQVDMGDDGHQAAWACDASGAQFHGSSSLMRLILCSLMRSMTSAR